MSQANLHRKILIVAFIITFLIIILLAAQVKSALYPYQGMMARKESNLLIGIVTSDSVVDQSWGSLAYEGKVKIEENYPVEVKLLAKMDTEEKMKRAALELLEQGAELIIGHGAEFSPLFSQLAPAYTETHFVTLNGWAVHPNQSSYEFQRSSPGYFAGIVAGLMTKSDKIGVINAYGPEDRGLGGFKLALQQYNPDAKVYQLIVGSRDDEEKAEELAKRMIESGVDVIFTRGNAYNRAVIHEAARSGIYVIGFVTDQSYMAEDYVLTSMVSHTPEAYIHIMEAFFSEEGIKAGDHILDYNDGVYSIAPFGKMVPKQVRETVQEQLEKYNRGEFNFDDLE